MPLGKSPTVSGLSFFIHKMDAMVLPCRTPSLPSRQAPRTCWPSSPLGSDVHPQSGKHAFPSTPLPGTPLGNSQMIYTSEDESIPYTAKDIFNLSQGLGYKVQQPLSTGRSILISIWPAGALLSLSSSFHPRKDVPPNQISFSRWGRET